MSAPDDMARAVGDRLSVPGFSVTVWFAHDFGLVLRVNVLPIEMFHPEAGVPFSGAPLSAEGQAWWERARRSATQAIAQWLGQAAERSLMVAMILHPMARERALRVADPPVRAVAATAVQARR